MSVTFAERAHRGRLSGQSERHVRRAVSAATWSRATRRPFKVSTRSARAWCGSAQDRIGGRPRPMLRSKPGLASESVGKAAHDVLAVPSEGASGSSTTARTTDAFGSQVCSSDPHRREQGPRRSLYSIGAGPLRLGKRGSAHEKSQIQSARPYTSRSIWFSPTDVLIGIHHGVSHRTYKPTSTSSPSASQAVLPVQRPLIARHRATSATGATGPGSFSTS